MYVKLIAAVKIVITVLLFDFLAITYRLLKNLLKLTTMWLRSLKIEPVTGLVTSFHVSHYYFTYTINTDSGTFSVDTKKRIFIMGISVSGVISFNSACLENTEYSFLT